MRPSITLSAIGLLLLNSAAAHAQEQPPQTVVVERCLVTPLQEVDVASKEAGVIEHLDVREGMLVKAGQELARLDEDRAVLEREQARFELQVAQLQSENDIDVRYAQATEAVAEAELAEMKEANRRVVNTVTAAQLRRTELSIKEATLKIEQARRDLELAKVTTDTRNVMLKLAELNIQRRKILAPVAGVVVECYRDAGEWVNPGDPVARVLRIDRLRVEGFLSAAEFGSEITDCPVQVQVDLPGGRHETFDGKITFVSPEIEPVANQFRIWAEVENRGLLLRVGAKAKMTIRLPTVTPSPGLSQ